MRTVPYEVNFDQIDEAAIAAYQTYGFIVIRGVLTKQEAARYREATLRVHEKVDNHHKADDRLTQFVNVWETDEALRALTLSPKLGRIAEQLARAPMRLWHDHVLIKKPHNKLATEFHQDQAYWPHSNSPGALSTWVALCDVPVERGCMTFIPGSQKLTDLPSQSLADPESFLSFAPQTRYMVRVTCPLEAGDCTFHHARTAHRANANDTDEIRTAHVIAYMNASTTYKPYPQVEGQPLRAHIVCRELDQAPGRLLDDEKFPTIDQMAASGLSVLS